MKMVVIKQNRSKRFANSFMIEILYQGLFFHLAMVIIKINKCATIHATGEKKVNNIFK